MTLTPPTVTPVTVDPASVVFRGQQDITPFTYRSGMTYTQLLESIRVWLYNTLVPYLNTNFEDVIDSWSANITQIDATINTALAAQADTINAALTAQQQQVADELATTLNQITSGESAALNDSAVYNALQVANSQALAFLDGRYTVTDGTLETIVSANTSMTRTYLDSRYARSGAGRYDAFLSPAPSGGDDTSVLNGWLAGAGRHVQMVPGSYSLTGTLTIPAGVELDARGAKFTFNSATAFTGVTVGANAALIGAELAGGSKTGGDMVQLSAVDKARVIDCYIHDVAGPNTNSGRGIAVVSGSTNYVIRGNRLVNIHAQAIDIDSSSHGVVQNNTVDTALHGIQMWGGDSSTTSVIGLTNVLVTGNKVKNVKGGIWATCSQYVTVTGNECDTLSDVGIDFEGCQDCTATGNTVHNAENACFSVFYGSQRILFAGNTGMNDASDAAGIQACFKAFTTNANKAIRVIGNVFSSVATVIVTDAGALSDSTVADNYVTNTAGGRGMRFMTTNTMKIHGNKVTVHGATGIGFEGGSDSEIVNNTVTTDTDTSAAGANSGGIFNYWTSSTASAQRNVIKDNKVSGFVQGIFDDQWGSGALAGCYTLIENNITSTLYRKSGTGYTGVINNNRVTGTYAAVTTNTV